jgi:hypothetical protein
MYTFNIENTDKNMVLDNKIVGGGGKFTVYKVSDFVLIDVNSSTSMDDLCNYFFAYVIYDILVNGETKMYYELQKKLAILEQLIMDKLYSNIHSDIVLDRSNVDINTFSEYISSLFSVTSAGSASEPVDINRATWEDVSSRIILSQGQYLHHLDSVYKKYEGIYHNEKDDHKLKKILDLNDESFRRGRVQGHRYSFHDKIEIRYTELQTIKDSNFFYKTEHFYIQDETILTQKFTTLSSIQELLMKHGIEKLIHIYYTYISLRDVKRLYQFRIHLRKAIAKFMCYNNIDIVNLLIFQDILFYKIIKNGASIIYNKDGSVDPVSKPLLKGELTIEDKTSSDNIDEPSLKHQLFYKYKELEKALRRYYLPYVYFGLIESRKLYHSAVDIIHVRQITLEDDLCLLDTEGEIIIDKMKSVTTFYKPEPEPSDPSKYQPCQLVRFIYRDESDEVGSMNTYCIGKIFTVGYDTETCEIELLTIIKPEYNLNFDETIDKISFDSNDQPVNDKLIALFEEENEVMKLKTSRSQSGGSMPTIEFRLIYDTSLLFGERSSKKCAFSTNFKITYKDYDLFNEKYDRQVTFSPLVYKIPFEDEDKPKVLFIIPESVQTFRPELKPLGDGTDEQVESKYAYITFNIVDNNSKKQLTLNKCNTITQCEIAGIFTKNTSLSDTYSEESKFCILIEEVKDDKYVKRAFDDNEKLDKLYFSTKEITLTLQ